MKICGLIAEYNPLHLGHLKQIDYIKTVLGADRLIVILSGNFCQRGEAAILDKYTRAKHAVAAGADIVIELPTVFATANAEIFASGAVKILAALGVVNVLCFGVESGTSESYISLAKAMNTESKDFKQALKRELDNGVSLARAKFNAVKALNLSGADEKLIGSPNNILGLEYTKALLRLNANIAIEPMIREGDHNDNKLYKNITSASSIRLGLETMKSKKFKKNVPSYVFADLRPPLNFDEIILSALITANAEDMKEILDCTEGLENRIKALLKDNLDMASLLDKVSTKRYTLPRIRRIMLANLLGIKADFIFKCLKSSLYIKVLAMKSTATDLIAEIKGAKGGVLLTRKLDFKDLEKTALECFNKDVLANDLYNLASKYKQNEFYTAII